MNYLEKSKKWVADFVIGLNLCPFAAVPFRKGQVRFVLEESNDPNDLMKTFLRELDFLYQADPLETETTLIVHPHTLREFLEYNDFLGFLDELLAKAGLSGVFQIASFHPDYQFEGVSVDDPANYTNRSPYPMLHLLREDSLSEALAHFPNPEKIPEVNMARLREMGVDGIRNYLKKQDKKLP